MAARCRVISAARASMERGGGFEALAGERLERRGGGGTEEEEEEEEEEEDEGIRNSVRESGGGH